MTESRRIVFSRIFYVVGAGLLGLLMWMLSQDLPPDPVIQKVYEPLEPIRVYIPFLASTLSFLIAIGLSRRAVQVANAPGKVSISLAGSSLLLILVGVGLIVWWQTTTPIRERNFLDAQHGNMVSDFRCELAKHKSFLRVELGKAASDEAKVKIETEYKRKISATERKIYDEDQGYRHRIIDWEKRYRIY